MHKSRSHMQKGTNSLLFQLEQTGELPPPKLIWLTAPFVRADWYEYVAQKLSSVSATAGKETSHADRPVLLW